MDCVTRSPRRWHDSLWAAPGEATAGGADPKEGGAYHHHPVLEDQLICLPHGVLHITSRIWGTDFTTHRDADQLVLGTTAENDRDSSS